MKCVVEIDNATYHRFVAGFANENDADLIEKIFKNAESLPEGHGAIKDVELVIKIPEKLYESVMDGTYCGTLYQELKNGVPLPKGHGRLVDADEFHHTLEDMPIRDNDKWFNWLQKTCNRLAEAPTIIEADKPRIRKGTPLEENDSGYNCENWIP